MRNTIVEVHIEGFQSFKHDRAGDMSPFAIVIYPESQLVQVCLVARRFVVEPGFMMQLEEEPPEGGR